MLERSYFIDREQPQEDKKKKLLRVGVESLIIIKSSSEADVHSQRHFVYFICFVRGSRFVRIGFTVNVLDKKVLIEYHIK